MFLIYCKDCNGLVAKLPVLPSAGTIKCPDCKQILSFDDIPDKKVHLSTLSGKKSLTKDGKV